MRVTLNELAGKIKKIGIGIGISIAVFFIFVIIVGFTSMAQEKQRLSSLSNEELQSMSEGWNYPQLLRNIDNYEGKTIHFSGKVTSSQPDIEIIGIQVGCSDVLQIADCDTVFVETTERFLVNDVVDGYGIVKGLRTLQITKPLGGGVVTEHVPNLEAIRVTCSSC
jgi:hypothetical protein